LKKKQEVPVDNSKNNEIEELKHQLTHLTEENRKHKDKFYKQEAEKLRIENDELKKKLKETQQDEVDPEIEQEIQRLKKENEQLRTTSPLTVDFDELKEQHEKLKEEVENLRKAPNPNSEKENEIKKQLKSQFLETQNEIILLKQQLVEKDKQTSTPNTSSTELLEKNTKFRKRITVTTNN